MGVLCGCYVAVTGCSSSGESSAITVIPPFEPLVGVRDGDSHEVFINVFCGADYLPIGVNDTTWRAAELNGDERGWVPPEWAAIADTIDGTSDMLLVEIQMDAGESRLIVTANGRQVSYRPMRPDDPANECE
jgi:hypothetical protein